MELRNGGKPRSIPTSVGSINNLPFIRTGQDAIGAGMIPDHSSTEIDGRHDPMKVERSCGRPPATGTESKIANRLAN